MTSTDPMPPLERRLAAIVFTDVVGYSALMQRDEPGTVVKVHADFARIADLCAAHGGEVLNAMGDGMLLCFNSAVEAVRCALALQGEFARRNAGDAAGSGLTHRIGIHLGDVFRQDAGGVTGDGVNIASRLESRAPPGGICASESVMLTVRGKLAVQEVFAGKLTLKNIAEPVTAYYLYPPGAPAAKPPSARRRNTIAVAVGLAVLLVGAAVSATWWWKYKDAASSTDAVEAKSIAILPFDNLSEAKENAYFTDGMHEDVLTHLVNVRDLRVISRASVMQYRGTKKPSREIGRELGVAYLLEGSVRRSGNRVRVTGLLTRASNNEQVWAKSFDRDLNDVFEIQTALAQEIAQALRAALSESEKATIERKPTQNIAAYELFLKARELNHPANFGEGKWTGMIDLLEQAVARDPSFAQAWGALAIACARHAFVGGSAADKLRSRAQEAMDTALRLAPDAPETIRDHAIYRYYGHRDYGGARKLFESVAARFPNDSSAQYWVGLLQRRQGNWGDSISRLRQATRLDPGNVTYSFDLAQTLGYVRRFDEAISERKRTMHLLPAKSFGMAAVPLMQYWKTGSLDELEAWFASLPVNQRESSTGHSIHAYIVEQRGDVAKYIQLDQRDGFLEGDFFGRWPWDQALHAAIIIAAQGDKAGAQRRLRAAREMLSERLRVDPDNAAHLAAAARIEAFAGNTSEAMRKSQRALDLLPASRDAAEHPDILEARAFALAWTGNIDSALMTLELLLKTPASRINVFELRNGFQYAPLKGHPRFEALLKNPANNAPLI